MTSNHRFHRGDPVAYLVWAFTPGTGWARVAREAEVLGTPGQRFRVKDYSAGQPRMRDRQVPGGHLRLITQHDGGKEFNLPITHVYPMGMLS